MHGSGSVTSVPNSKDLGHCNGVDKNQPETKREKGLDGEEWCVASVSLTVFRTQVEAICSLTNLDILLRRRLKTARLGYLCWPDRGASAVGTTCSRRRCCSCHRCGRYAESR